MSDQDFYTILVLCGISIVLSLISIAESTIEVLTELGLIEPTI